MEAIEASVRNRHGGNDVVITYIPGHPTEFYLKPPYYGLNNRERVVGVYGLDSNDTFVEKPNHDFLSKKRVVRASSTDPVGYEEATKGDVVVIVFPNGDEKTTSVKSVSSRQIVTQYGTKYKRSDGLGWNTEPTRLKGSVSQPESDDDDGGVDLTSVDVGDVVVLSDGSEAEVTKATKRQVRAAGYKFARSDGQGWADQEISVTAIK